MSSTTFTFNPTMSLYIARVYETTSKSFIIKVFEENIRFGKIRSVHMQKIPGSKHNYTAIIHFESWNETIVTTNFQTRIFKQGFARVVHNDPWYWIVMENNSQIVYPVQDTTEATATAQEEEEIDPKIKYKYFFEMVNGIVNNVKNINNIQNQVVMN
jgi:hypothetical protein